MSAIYPIKNSRVTYSVAEMTVDYYLPVVALANQVHGAGYMDVQKLAGMVQQGTVQGRNASFVALMGQRVIGYRLCFAAGQWQPDQWCSQQQWPFAAAKMAYFKSVAVDPDYQGLGIGQAMLQSAVTTLKRQGACAGLAHLWRESPNNSAVRYFSKAGGELLKIHENRWQALSHQGYVCPVCQGLCSCSAAEMVIVFA